MKYPTPPRLKELRFIAIIALTTLVLAGCSSTKLAYRYADWGIAWWVDDYIPMTNAQERQLKRDISDFRDWHCDTQLPQYSDWLAELEQDLRSGEIGSARVSYHQDQLFSFFQPLTERAKPAVVHLLADLSEQQVQAFADNMADSQAELEEEFLSENPEQTRQARAERTQDRVERWLGSLNPAQTNIVKQWSDARGQQTEIWLEGRRKWQQALLETLEHRNNEDFAGKMDYLIDNNDEVRGPRYQEMMAESESSMADLMSDLLKNADQNHLDHLLNEASGLRSDFDDLACNR